MAQPQMALADPTRAFVDSLDIPVIVANRIRTAQEAETMIVGGAAHAVPMARTWIADPGWARKYEAGDDARVRPCVSCIGNPLAGREIEFSAIDKTATAKNIAVIGGGPAGMEVARLAALRGHSVTLYEASSVLGGQLA